MSRAEKLLEKMRRNPRDWRIEDLVVVAARQGLQVRNDGGSHFIFSAPGSNLHLSIPSRRPIKPLSVEYGDAQGTPHIVAREAPCVLCEGLLCTTVCPSGALVPVRRATEVQMGGAVIDAARCLPHRGEKCSVCLDRCPIQGALRLDDKGRPVVQDTCTGCGICEYYCPTEPTSIKVRPWSVRK